MDRHKKRGLIAQEIANWLFIASFIYVMVITGSWLALTAALLCALAAWLFLRWLECRPF